MLQMLPAGHASMDHAPIFLRNIRGDIPGGLSPSPPIAQRARSRRRTRPSRSLTLSHLSLTTPSRLSQLGLLLGMHEAMRPTARDRNLVGQGFEDPSRPGSLCPFPSPSDPPVLGLSVILPVRNDAPWLAATLPELLQTLQVLLVFSRGSVASALPLTPPLANKPPSLPPPPLRPGAADGGRGGDVRAGGCGLRVT